MHLLTPLLLFGIGSAFREMISAIFQPIYWAVSGIIVLAHKMWTAIGLNPDSGLTWVLSIVTLTVVIRTLLIPLFVKQINSARSMQLIQPKAKALQEKYGHDRERLGQETMKLYREEGVNPAASCLPLLLQMPIFLALFRVLEGIARNPEPIVRGHFFKTHPELVDSLREATFMGASLSGRFMPFSASNTATKVMAGVLMLTMTAVLFIQQLQLMQKNMPPEALTGPMAQQQKMMLYLFPIMYLFGGVAIPIGVLFYWMTTNLWTLAQQYILIHNNPTPNTPAYVDWQERMRAKGKDPDQIEADRRAKRLRRVNAGTGGATAATLVDDENGSARPTVQRQGVQRQTVRKTTGSDTQAIRRQQPQRQTRNARKKK